MGIQNRMTELIVFAENAPAGMTAGTGFDLDSLCQGFVASSRTCLRINGPGNICTFIKANNKPYIRNLFPSRFLVGPAQVI